jgi:hypothetical protein
VNFVVTTASLLSGKLRDCAYEDIASIKCTTGGVASVQALVRYYTTTTTTQEPTLVIPVGDFKAPLTEMSTFYFGVNVMIYANVLKWRTWTVPAYTVQYRRFDYDSVYDAQEPLLPVLVSNVITYPNERWHPYVKSIHFDEETKLAIIWITKEYIDNTVSQIGTTNQLLHYIYKYNQSNRCSVETTSTTTASSNASASAYSIFQDIPFSEWWIENGDNVVQSMHDSNSNNNNITDHGFPISTQSMLSNTSPDNCYVPIVIFDDVDKVQFDTYIDAFLNNQTNNNITHLPHLIVDINGHAIVDDDEIDEKETDDDDQSNYHIQPLIASPTSSTTTTTWLVSYKGSPDEYHQLRIKVSPDRQSIEGVSMVHENLLDIPDDVKDEQFYQDLDNIRQYANEALESSLAQEQGVKTLKMPEQTNPVDGFRYCYVGECQMGNLYADSIRWIEDADVAVLPSFMFDGPGWEEGEIRTLEILENLPYATSRCAGTMTGHSLLRLLNYSIITTSFGGYDSEKVGGLLLQLSGLKVVYNNELEDASSAIISVDVLDRESNEYVPLEMTRLYKFASCAHLCFTFVDFPPLMGEERLNTKVGEVAAVQTSDTDIKVDLKQYLLSEFAESNYEPALEGRLVKDESRTDPIQLIEREDCVDGTSYWSSDVLDCVPCPDFEHFELSKTKIDLIGGAFQKAKLRELVWMTNMELYPINVVADTLALPDNIELSLSSDELIDDSGNVTGPFLLKPTKKIAMEIEFDPSNRGAGRDTSSVVFVVSAVPHPLDCPVEKLKYDIIANLSFSTDENHLGPLATFGYTCAAFIVIASLLSATWVRVRRNSKVVSTMQPTFLIALCVGVLLLGLALIPFSIDDGVVSERGCDIACISLPWLLSVGFTLCVSALFSKLLRINKLFHSRQFRRMQVRERDVIFSTSVLFIANIILNIIWTAADPISWERTSIPAQPNVSYGKCSMGDGRVGRAMLGSIVSVCVIGFFMTCWQAYRARNISSEFSESKYLGIALYGWFQLAVVSTPVLFLVDDSNVPAKYSLAVGIIFALCMSMLLVIFVPIMIVKQKSARRDSQSRIQVIYGDSLKPNGSSARRGSSSDFFKRLKHEAPAMTPLGPLQEDSPSSQAVVDLPYSSDSKSQQPSSKQESDPDETPPRPSTGIAIEGSKSMIMGIGDRKVEDEHKIEGEVISA